jgi:hypothetical protein
MAVLTNSRVETLARQLLWDQIERSTWFSGLAEEAKAAAVAADVEQWWHLKAGEAAQILVSQVATQSEAHPFASAASTA